METGHAGAAANARAESESPAAGSAVPPKASAAAANKAGEHVVASNGGGGNNNNHASKDDDGYDSDDDDDESDSPVLHHHFLQHAPSDRSSCAHCDGPSPLGQVRIGRPYLPPARLRRAGEHSWVSWEHLRCLSQDQARRLLVHARAHAHDDASTHDANDDDDDAPNEKKRSEGQVATTEEEEEEEEEKKRDDDAVQLLANYFVVPPSVHAGGSGPESGTINKVLR